MNKKLIFILASVPVLAIAEERTLEDAAVIAQQFMKTQSGHRAPGQVSLQCAYTQSMPNLEREAFYVFNTPQQGFVLVSAETNSPAILGYSNSNAFVAQDLPAHVQSWFDYYAAQVEWLAQHPTVKAYETKQTYTPIKPLLKEMEWGQDAPYNYLCPIMPNEKSRSVVGCTATATAQIMGFHQWPKHAKGKHSLPYDRSKEIDYDKDGEYDWDNILPINYRYYRTTPEQDTAVAKLMWHVGVACDMQYSAAGSGASEVEMAYRMIKHFDYDPSIQEYYLDYSPADTFVNMLYQQLLLKQPVLITGYTTNWEGHAFVCDGIDENGKLHINWGWDGVANGNFLITLLDPNNQGTGGSASDLAFTQFVAAIVNIKPNEGGVQTPSQIVTDSVYYTGKSLVVNQGDKLLIEMRHLDVWGLWGFKGQVGLGIYQNDQFIRWFKHSHQEIESYSMDKFDMSAVFPKDLPSGEYDLCFSYQSDGQEKIERSYFANRYCVHLEVTDDQIIINGGIDLTMSDVDVQVDEYLAYMTWNSKAPFFHIQILSDKRTLVDSISSSTAFLFKNDSVGVYCYHILPLTKDKTQSIWQGKSGEFFLTKEYPVTDLQVTGTEDEYSVLITWVSEAPKFKIEVKSGKKSIASAFISATSSPLTIAEGTYTFSVTPYEEAEIHPIGETQTIEITLPYLQPDGLGELYSTPKQVIKVINGQQIILQKNNHQYNILGNEQHK
ncbi:MAG: C10 family peptidase [Paludibacteraceae bacterium]|nr:C10 family peptidase [Paludibacteraceae bacterium]